MLEGSARMIVWQAFEIAVEILMDRLRDEAFLGLECIVQCAFGDTGTLADLIHTEPGHTAFSDQFSRLIENSLAPSTYGRARIYKLSIAYGHE